MNLLNYSVFRSVPCVDGIERISWLHIAHRDRFVRFGFSWFEKLCQKFDNGIIVVNNETLSPEEELVSDIVSILHVFSCRLYGLRKYKKIIWEDEDIVKML